MVRMRNFCLAGSACSWQLSRHLSLGLLCLLGVLFSDVLCSIEQSNLFLLWKAPCFTIMSFCLRKGGIWIVLKHWNYVGSEIVSDRDVLMPLLRNQFLHRSPMSSECPQALGFTPVLWIYYHHYWWATGFVFTMWLSSEEPERLKLCPVVWPQWCGERPQRASTSWWGSHLYSQGHGSCRRPQVTRGLPAKVIDSRERGEVVGKLGKPLAWAQSSIPPFEVYCWEG